MFSACFTALITPLRDGKIDERAFRSLVDWQVSRGISGLVVCGTTGESPTLSHQEHMRLTQLCVESAAGRVPVIAGTGSNSTQETIDFARHAEQVGADAQLVVAPYYNKPTQRGLYQHFKAVHDNSGLPIIIYNIPSRSVVDPLWKRLWSFSNCDGLLASRMSAATSRASSRSGQPSVPMLRSFRGTTPCICWFWHEAVMELSP